MQGICFSFLSLTLGEDGVITSEREREKQERETRKREREGEEEANM